SKSLFIKRRLVRIWPLTILSLVFVLVFWLVQIWLKSNIPGFADLKVAGRDPITLIPAALLLQVFITQCIWWLTPLWSLSAEWFSNLLYLFLKTRTQLILVSCLGFVLIAIGLVKDAAWIAEHGPIRHFEAIGRGIAGFGLGLLVRKLFTSGKRITSNGWLWVVGSSLVFMLNVAVSGVTRFGVLVAPLTAALLVFTLANWEPKGSFIGKVSHEMGLISFAVYLFHRPLIDRSRELVRLTGLDSNSTLSNILEIVVTLVLTVAVSYAVVYWFEIPVRKWLTNRFKLGSKSTL
ncbi:MAG: acyltransferase family protein, partial [Micrococcales bacterium]